MALTKTRQLKVFNVDGETKKVWIGLETIITDDIIGEEFRRIKGNEFVPGQVEDVKSWAGVGNQNPYIVFLNAIWTPAVIATYQASIANQG
jgi:hypothetical protein